MTDRLNGRLNDGGPVGVAGRDVSPRHVTARRKPGTLPGGGGRAGLVFSGQEFAPGYSDGLPVECGVGCSCGATVGLFETWAAFEPVSELPVPFAG